MAKVHFLVLSHTFGYLEQKLLGQLRKLFFLKSNFYVSENFKFQYFSAKLGKSVDGHEKIII
jgi:hypothetical protein